MMNDQHQQPDWETELALAVQSASTIGMLLKALAELRKDATLLSGKTEIALVELSEKQPGLAWDKQAKDEMAAILMARDVKKRNAERDAREAEREAAAKELAEKQRGHARTMY